MPSSAQPRRLTARDLVEKLRVRYSPPEWAFFAELRSGTGAGAGRTADVVAFNTYPSRGLEIHGVEIKVTRSDWLRELAQPDKAEAFTGCCDRWWIATPSGIVRREELPRTWGLLELSASGLQLKAKVNAPLNGSSAMMPRAFAAAIMRRAAEQSRQGASARATAAAYRDGHKDGRSAAELRDTELITKTENVIRRMAEFEEASGVSLDTGVYSGGQIGDAVRAILGGNLHRYHWPLETALRNAERAVKILREGLEALDEASPEGAAAETEQE